MHITLSSQNAFHVAGFDTDDKEGDSDCSITLKSLVKARKVQPVGKRAKVGKKVVLPKPKKVTKNSGGKTTFTVDSVMLAFTDKTEFGISFREMNAEQQKLEVDTLNKGAATGLKGAMKKNRIQVQFKTLVTEKMCPALGIKKEVFAVHHKKHIAKVN
jgi:hypothetical protein